MWRGTGGSLKRSETDRASTWTESDRCELVVDGRTRGGAGNPKDCPERVRLQPSSKSKETEVLPDAGTEVPTRSEAGPHMAGTCSRADLKHSPLEAMPSEARWSTDQLPQCGTKVLFSQMGAPASWRQGVTARHDWKILARPAEV